MAICEPCNKQFKDSMALKQHLQSPLGADHPSCARCNKRFNSEHSRSQHVASSPQHHVCGECPDGEDFESKRKLKQHVAEAHRKVPDVSGSSVPSKHVEDQQASNEQSEKKMSEEEKKLRLDTPLDFFFLSYPTFPYDPRLSPQISFQLLEKHFGWKKPKKDDHSEQALAAKDARSRYRDALLGEVRTWFGYGDDIEAWHLVCKAMGLANPPDDIPGCRKLFRRKMHVNIVDLVHWARSGDEQNPVQVFKTVAALREYTLGTGKIFPLYQAKAPGNFVLKHLLRQTF